VGPEDSLRALALRDDFVRVSLGIAPYDLSGYERVIELTDGTGSSSTL
jgi:TatD DNase family protein